MLYEADSLDVLTSEAYLTRLNNPTPWSSETMPHFRNMTRALCRVTESFGLGTGGKMAFVPLSPDPSKVGQLRNWIAETLAPLSEQQGMLGAHLLEGDGTASRTQTREKELRGDADGVADWLLLLEGYGFLGSVFERGPFERDALLEKGAATVGRFVSYSLSALLMESEI